MNMIPPLPVTQLAHDLSILVIYFLLGAGIKYIDQAYDIRVFNKKTATIIAVPTGLLMAAIVIVDPPSATIFIAMALGLLVTKKIDNIAFQIGIVLVVLLPIFFVNLMDVFWLPFSVLFLACLADEYGNDWSDKHYLKKLAKKHHKTLKRTELTALIMRYRSVMKITIIGLVVTKQLAFIYLPAFLLFDLGYTLVERISFDLIPYSIKDPHFKKEDNPLLYT
jgi:hypothetical protein